MKAGARIEVDERKRNPVDFALWKKAKPDEPYWESPWGRGRPGWHIECSAMSSKYLGESFDIHGGGMDLIFPHHENEIAQSEGASGKQFVKYWLHNGFITVDQEKMGKSLGNFFTIKDVMKKYPAETIRFLLLSTHYRAPIDFSDSLLVNAANNLSKLHNCTDNLEASMRTAADGPLDEAEKAVLDDLKGDREKFFAAMDDDFNTPLAISAVFEIVKKANLHMMVKGQKKVLLSEILRELNELGGILNLYRTEKVSAVGGPSDAEIDRLVEERQAARKAKDFRKSDEVRDRLKGLGIILEDQKDGTVRWKRAR